MIMKKAVLIFEGIFFLLFLFSSCEQKEILPIEKNASVNFSMPSGILEKNNPEGLWIKLHLSRPAYEAGEVSIKQVDRGESNPFNTSPEISPEGIIKIKVPKGSTEIKFKVTPIDDENFDGQQEVLFQIDAVKGKLFKGSLKTFELKIQD